jgi:hypothetical protein
MIFLAVAAASAGTISVEGTYIWPKMASGMRRRSRKPTTLTCLTISGISIIGDISAVRVVIYISPKR